MIASNPMLSGMYLVHTKEPNFIARVVNYKEDPSLKASTLYKGIYYGLDVHMLPIGSDHQYDPDRLEKILRRAADWLHTALKEMDKKSPVE